MKRFAIAVVILLAGAFLLTRWLGSHGTDEVRLTGVVSANEAVVASELSGRIRELRVDEGDWVEKGQVVAVLATDEIEAQRESKLATIDQLSRRVEQDREKVRLERARVTSQIEGATAQLRAVESQSAEYRAQLAQAKKELAHTDELIEQGLVPMRRRERNETMVSVYEARLQAAEDAIEAARAELALHSASERQVRVMEQQVEQTEAQITQAKAELEQISVRLGYTELRSPLDGMVSVRVAREGEFVAAGAPVVTIVDLSDVWVRAQVEETLVTRLVVGQPLPVRLVSDEELMGRVTFISPEAEFATQRDVDRVKRDIRTFGVKVAVPNPDRRVHPGMTAYVILPAAGELPELPAPIAPGPIRGPATTESAPAPSEPAGVAAKHAPAPPTRAAASTEPTSAAPHGEPGEGHPTSQADGPAAAPRRMRAGSEPAPPAGDAERRASPTAPAVTDADEDMEALLAGMDLDDLSEDELAQLEATILDEPAVPRNGKKTAPEAPNPATASGGADASLPAWARPHTDPASPKTASGAADLAELRLEGISRIDGKPVAIINGVRVFEGQSVAGARVVNIAEATVVLDRGGRRFTLSF